MLNFIKKLFGVSSRNRLHQLESRNESLYNADNSETPASEAFTKRSIKDRSIKERLLEEYVKRNNAFIQGACSADFNQPGFARTEDQASDWQVLTVHSNEPALDELFTEKWAEQNETTYSRWLLDLAELANTISPSTASAPIDVISMLAEDENLDVRFALAENYNIDESILERLSEDENPYVAHRAKRTLARLRAEIVDREFGGDPEPDLRKFG